MNSQSQSHTESEFDVGRLQRLLFENLFASSVNGDLESVKRLVRMKADVNRGDPPGDAPPPDLEGQMPPPPGELYV